MLSITIISVTSLTQVSSYLSHHHNPQYNYEDPNNHNEQHPKQY